MAGKSHGRLAVVALKPDDAPEILMIEVALSEDDKITIADQGDVRPLSAHLRMLTNELIMAVQEEVNDGIN